MTFDDYYAAARKIPANDKFTDYEIFESYDENYRSRRSGLLDSAKTGLLNTESALAGADLQAGMIDKDQYARSIAGINQQLSTKDQNPYARKMVEDIDRSEGFLETLAAVAGNPRGAIHLGTEQLGNLLPIGGMAALGSAGGWVGAGLGAGAAMTALEVGSELNNALADAGVDMTDQAAIKTAVSNPDFIDRALKRGLIRSAAIVAIDMGAMGISRWSMGSSSRVIKNLLSNKNIDLNDTKAVLTALNDPADEAMQVAVDAYAKSKTVKGKIKRGTGGLGLETTGEMLGEMSAQAAVGDELNKTEIVLEGVGGFGLSVASTGVAMATSTPKKLAEKIALLREKRAAGAGPGGAPPPGPPPGGAGGGAMVDDAADINRAADEIITEASAAVAAAGGDALDQATAEIDVASSLDSDVIEANGFDEFDEADGGYQESIGEELLNEHSGFTREPDDLLEQRADEEFNRGEQVYQEPQDEGIVEQDPLAKQKPKAPRQHAAEIGALPAEEQEEAIAARVAPQFQNMVREHIADAAMKKQGKDAAQAAEKEQEVAPPADDGDGDLQRMRDEIKAIRDEISLSEVESASYFVNQLDGVLSDNELNGSAVKAWLERAKGMLFLIKDAPGEGSTQAEAGKGKEEVAKKPPEKDSSKAAVVAGQKLLGKNSQGNELYEDEAGTRSIYDAPSNTLISAAERADTGQTAAAYLTAKERLKANASDKGEAGQTDKPLKPTEQKEESPSEEDPAPQKKPKPEAREREDAEDKKAAPEPEPEPEPDGDDDGARLIGKNSDGNDLYEDANGIRSYSAGGAAIMSEPVEMETGKARLPRSESFLTAQERLATNKSKQEAESKETPASKKAGEQKKTLSEIVLFEDGQETTAQELLDDIDTRLNAVYRLKDCIMWGLPKWLSS